MEVKVSGFDEFSKELKNSENKVDEAAKTQSVSFVDLFHEGFMKEYTKFESIDEFFDKSPFEFESNEDFDKIDESELDKYVAENTDFNSWEDMLGTAGQEHIAKQLGF